VTRRPRAAIAVTGSELVRGDRRDANGPFLAGSLLALGVEPARITVVGDGPEELERAFAEGLGHDLLVTSGGLGPTHDDRTVELLARTAGLPLVVDEDVERAIEERSRAIAKRLQRPYVDFAAGVRKQATVPEGATVVGLAGTAPALAFETDGCVVVILPGPPRELQALWPRALDTEPLRRLLARAAPPERRVLRLFGVSESAVARALEEAGGDGHGVEATICARDFEIHVDLVADPGAGALADALAERLAAPLEEYLFARDGEEPVAALVLRECRARGLSLATAESCTGGLVAARLTSVPGSSDVFLGSVVSYANEVKVVELGVSPATLEEFGAVSAETAEAMARGVRARLHADVAVAVTGVAGPDGGTAEKPVGLVFLHASGPGGDLAASFALPGDRETVRARATASALHLVRRLVTKS
jgi:nicotinamide-nucleotide amidase